MLATFSDIEFRCVRNFTVHRVQRFFSGSASKLVSHVNNINILVSNSNYDPRIAEYNPEGEEYLSISQAEYSSESMSMSSSNPSSSSTGKKQFSALLQITFSYLADLVDPDIDFLEWPYYQRNDKRH